MKPEAKIQAAIIRYLKTLKAAGEPIWWVKIHGGPHQQAGIPDLAICYFGLSVWLEVKALDGETTRLQEEVIQNIRATRGTAFVVRSAGDVRFVLDQIKEGNHGVRNHGQRLPVSDDQGGAGLQRHAPESRDRAGGGA